MDTQKKPPVKAKPKKRDLRAEVEAKVYEAVTRTNVDTGVASTTKVYRKWTGTLKDWIDFLRFPQGLYIENVTKIPDGEPKTFKEYRKSLETKK